MTSITTVLSFLSALVIVPLLLPMMLIFKLYRNALRYLIRKDFGDAFETVSGDDAFWLQDKPENRGIINALLKLEGAMDLERYRRVLTERLLTAEDPKRPGKKLFPKLTSYTTRIMHRYVWLPEAHFDIKEHVYIHPDPCPKTKPELEQLIGVVCSSPLPVHKSPWQFILLAGANKDVQEDELHYALFRVHHSIADGISLVRVFLKYVVDEPPREENVQRFGAKDFARKAVSAVFQGPTLLLSRLTRPADNNIIHGTRLSGIKAFSWSDPVNLDLIKRIKNATGSTVNDVLISCLASAFARYFQRHASVVPKNILAYIPVDVRRSTADITLDNQFALVFLDLPLDSYHDPVRTLHKTKRRMDRIKASPEPLVNALAIKYCMNRLPGWFTETAFDWAAAKSSLVLSNVPGPKQKLRLASAAVDSMVFWPPQRTCVGLSVSIFTYNGDVTVGINADTRILSNPGVLIDQFVPEVQRLVKALDL